MTGYVSIASLPAVCIDTSPACVTPGGGEVTGRETAGAGAAAIVGRRHSLMGRSAL